VRVLHTYGEYPPDWKEIAERCKAEAGFRCIRCDHPNDLPSGHLLTVHHMTGNKADCEWFNLLALCQRCHLRFQGRVNPDVPYFLEHSPWYKPYVAGFYAKKYLKLDLTREEVMARLDELLALERAA
jgi:hypothetical protein